MGIHAYCISPSSHRPFDGLAGVEGANVRSVESGGLCMWVSIHASRPDASMAAIQSHNTVVVGAMTPVTTPVPMRFGQWLDDEAAAVAVLSASRMRWETLLEKFAGAVEYGIRIFDPARNDRTEGGAATEAAHGSGRAYMEALVRKAGGEHAVADRVLTELAAALGGLVIDQQTEALRTAHGLLSVAHLVHLARADAYREAVDAVRSRMPELRLLSSGPWPPYSFVL
jgi:hypothetical protein